MYLCASACLIHLLIGIDVWSLPGFPMIWSGQERLESTGNNDLMPESQLRHSSQEEVPSFKAIIHQNSHHVVQNPCYFFREGQGFEQTSLIPFIQQINSYWPSLSMYTSTATFWSLTDFPSIERMRVSKWWHKI